MRAQTAIDCSVRLKQGREKKLVSFYPWVQREEVASTDRSSTPGELARVFDSRGGLVGIGMHNPLARFAVRMLTLGDEPIDEAFFSRRIETALARRDPEELGADAYRCVFAESDGLPGLIVDRYGDTLVVQVRAAGMELLRPLWLPALLEATGVSNAYERSDMEGRREEGLEPHSGVLAGNPPEVCDIVDAGLRLKVPIRTGPKTGYYLDQRDNRRLLRELVRPGERVLDLFTYSGGFALAAIAAGAESVGVDLSEDAIRAAEHHAKANGLKGRFIAANAFDWIKTANGVEKPFDWIVVDPPAIAKSSAKRDSLRWAIWNIVYHGLPLLRSGGGMAVFSCSYQLGFGELLETIRLAASDRGRRATLFGATFQPQDHPYLIQFPESLYLKGAWLRFE